MHFFCSIIGYIFRTIKSADIEHTTKDDHHIFVDIDTDDDFTSECKKNNIINNNNKIKYKILQIKGIAPLIKF